MRITFTVLGQPKAQARHKHFKKGSFSGTYDPSKGVKKDFLTLAHENAPNTPFDCPLRVDIKFYFQRPKNHYGSGRNTQKLKTTAPHFHTTRPDIDNCRKFIMDSLNKVFWRDDSIICAGSTQKLYSNKPRTEIIIEVL